MSGILLDPPPVSVLPKLLNALETDVQSLSNPVELNACLAAPSN